MKELKNTNTAKQIIGSRPIMTALLAALALLLASCSNGINGTDASGSSADGKTYISISAKTASSRSIARTLTTTAQKNSQTLSLAERP